MAKEIYLIAFSEKAEGGKSVNGTTLQLLTEIEKSINMHLNEFMYDEKIEPNTVLMESKKIQKDQRQINREEVILI